MASTMAPTKFPSLASSSSLYNFFSAIPKLSSSSISSKTFAKLLPLLPTTQASFFPITYTTTNTPFRDLGLRHTTQALNQIVSRSRRRLSSNCFAEDSERNSTNVDVKKTGFDWQILKRWDDVPWEWYTVALTLLAYKLSMELTTGMNAAAILYLGIQITDLPIYAQAGAVLFIINAHIAAAILGGLYGLANIFKPLPDDIFCCDRRQPFHLQKGWLLWAGIGLVGFYIMLLVAVLLFCKNPQTKTLNSLLLEYSSVSIACLLGNEGVITPVVRETVFRGFLMVSLSKWVPTPVAVYISAVLSTLLCGDPSLLDLVFGTVAGLCYAQTRNLLTPIAMHVLFKSGLILILAFLKLQGYYLKK